MYICNGIQQETHSCVHAHSTIKKPAMIKIKFTNHFETKNQSIIMKRAIAMVFVALMMSISTHAQKIQVLDADGNAIPLVSVLTEDGVLIGTTDINGTLANVKGAAKVALTHLAYKPQLVSVASLTDGRVTMESVDYGLAEVVVKPKPVEASCQWPMRSRTTIRPRYASSHPVAPLPTRPQVGMAQAWRIKWKIR